MLQAFNSLHTGKYEQAIQEYSDVIARSPQNGKAYQGRATCFTRTGQNRAALADANRWAALCPKDQYHLLKGVLLSRLDRNEQALVELNQGIEEQKDRPEAYFYRSLARLKVGQYEGAKADAYEHLKVVPDSTISFESCSFLSALCADRANAVYYLGQYAFSKSHRAPELHVPLQRDNKRVGYEVHFNQGALSDTQRQNLLTQLKTKKNSLSADGLSFARGVIFFYLRNFEQAAGQISHCASARARVETLLVIFYSHLFGRNFTQARADLGDLVAHFPYDQNVLDAVDIYHYEVDKRQAGVAEIKDLLKKNPKNVAALTELSKIYRDLGHLGEALKYCEAALELAPNSDKLLLSKTKILIGQEKEKEALKVLDKLTALRQSVGPVCMLRAAILTHQEQWARAIDPLTEAIKLKYDFVKALEARSACYTIMKKPELAKHDLLLAEDIDPKLWQMRLLSR